MKIGFWNIGKDNDLSDMLASWTVESQLDIVCLAELSGRVKRHFLEKINKYRPTSNQKYNEIKSKKNKVAVISRYADSIFTDQSHHYTSNRWTAFTINLTGIIKFNLFVVHFPSKVNWSNANLALECVNFARDIEVVESETRCSNSVLMGDFNMSPFEDGVVAANGLHAIPDLAYAQQTPKRIVNNTTYDFFYNPMWNFFGDFESPFGTYYCRPAGHISHEWHIYDQLIVRPSMRQYFDNPFVEIVTTIAGDSLINNLKRPNKQNYSDHLPILFNLKL